MVDGRTGEGNEGTGKRVGLGAGPGSLSSVHTSHPVLSLGFGLLLPGRGRVSANRRACDPFSSHPENIRCKAQDI